MSPASVDKTKDFLLGERFSDMKITCQGQTFKVHRFIICKQSSFFETALTGPFKESSEQTVDLLDDDPETIERVVSYLYMNDYQEDGHIVPLDGISEPEQAEDETATGEPAKIDTTRAIGSNHVQVYIAADKFGIANLKSLARDKFAKWANANWASPTFVEILQEVIISMPPHDLGLRNVIADVISKHVIALVSKGTMLQLTEASGNIWSEVINRLVSSNMVRESEEEKDCVSRARSLDLIAQKLENHTFCRHCDTGLNVRMESYEYRYGTFRCGVCRTRH